MKNKAYLTMGVFLALTAIALTAAAATPAKQAGATATPDHVILTWTGDPMTTQTITWRASADVTWGVVSYRPANSNGDWKDAAANPTAVKTDRGPENIFSVTLHGLASGTKYSYRVGNGTKWTDLYSFTTAPKPAGFFKFIVCGDSQSGNPNQIRYEPWARTVHNACRANPDARFLVNLGDLVEIGGMNDHWNAWFKAAAGVVENIPDMTVQGNHETYQSAKFDSGKPALYTQQFMLPANGPRGLQGQAYSYDYGFAHIVVLDSQQEEEQPVSSDILKPQKQWLERDLALTKQPWKIVAFHKTPYYNKSGRPNEDVKSAFVPILDRFHVDVVFNGHDHGYSRTWILKGDRFVQKPSQGTVYVVAGRSGNKSYDDLSTKFWNAFFYDPQDMPNYLTVEVSDKVLVVKCFKQDDTPIDTYTLDKARDADCPKSSLPSTAWAKYARPTMAVYGSVLPPTMRAHEPLLKDHVWYVDLHALFHYLGETVTKTDAQYSVTLKGKQYWIGPSAVITDKGVALVSSKELVTKCGFSMHFYSQINVVAFAK